jgi:hypothetical protein
MIFFERSMVRVKTHPPAPGTCLKLPIEPAVPETGPTFPMKGRTQILPGHFILCQSTVPAFQWYNIRLCGIGDAKLPIKSTHRGRLFSTGMVLLFDNWKIIGRVKKEKTRETRARARDEAGFSRFTGSREVKPGMSDKSGRTPT